VLAEAGRERVALDRVHLVQHLEGVVVHVEVMEHVLLHAAELEQLRQHLSGDPVRLHQAQPGPHRRRADDVLELAEDPLGRDALEARRLAPDRRRGCRLDRQVEIDRDPHGAQRPQRVLGQRAGADHPQPAGLEVGAAAVGIAQRSAGQRLGHRVDGEVACGEVGLDVAVAQDDQVDVPAVLGSDDAPRAERPGELERGAAGLARGRPRGVLRVLGQREIEIRGGAAEQAVAHGAAHDPRRAPGEHRAGRVDGNARAHPAAPR